MQPKASPLDAVFEKALRRNYPLNVLFELTHRCNLNCIHCYVPKPGAELTTSAVKRILAQVAEAGGLFVTFTGGEVLCRSDFFDLATSAVKRKLAIKIFTNGTLINKDTAGRIADLRPVEVGMSIHAAEPGEHDAFTRSPGSFARTMEALRLVKEQGIKINIKLVVTNRNYRDFRRIKRLIDDMGAELSFGLDISPARDGSLHPIDCRLDREALTEALGQGFFYEDAYLLPLAEREPLDLTTTVACNAGRDQCAITAEGRVQPCAMLPVVAGDLTRQDFKDIWHGPVLAKLRALRLSDLDECSSCKSLRFCRRCSGMALLEDGDMSGPSSWACMVAAVNEEIDRSATVGLREVSG